MKTVCAWCKVVLRADPGPDCFGVVDTRVSHGICPACREKWLKNLPGASGLKSPESTKQGTLFDKEK